MPRRFEDRGFDEEETMDQDPLGEDAFDEQGFDDAPDGGPRFSAPELREEEELERRPGRLPQKMAGIPESEQHRTVTPSRERPDSSAYVIRERGGLSKGDPAVGGTRDVE